VHSKSLSLKLTFMVLALFPAVLAQTASSSVSADERLAWLLRENVSPPALIMDLATSEAGTLFRPPSNSIHQSGFGARAGMVIANGGVSTVMEAGLGSIWGEDPRYTRTNGRRFQARLSHAIMMTFLANKNSGHTAPAYARFVAIPGTSFLSNQWRPDQDSTPANAATRAGLGFVSRMAENIFQEFRPQR